MIVKPREVPISLRLRRCLRPRMTFSDKDMKQFLLDEKGYAGECHFDELIAQSAATSYLQLNDLLLHSQNTTFQIDSLFFSPHKIYHFEIKNFEGDFYLEGDGWYFISGKEIKNPIIQLQRTASPLRSLHHSLDVNLPMESHVIFVNPEFTLFQAPKNLPIILPTQLNSFIKRLGSVFVKPYDPLMEAAKRLTLLDDKDSIYRRMHVPKYTYESVEKGVACFKCGSLSVHLDGRWLICDICGCKENLQSGIMRSVEEHKLLFPTRFITVPEMLEWCGLEISRQRMQKTLRDHLKMVSSSTSTYYC